MSNGFQRWCPTDIFNTGQNGEVCEIKQFKVNVVAAAVDTALVTAVSGKKIRLLYLNIFAATAITTADLNTKPAGAGTSVFSAWVRYQEPNTWEFSPEGIIETNTGEGLACTAGAGSNIIVMGRYIEFI